MLGVCSSGLLMAVSLLPMAALGGTAGIVNQHIDTAMAGDQQLHETAAARHIRDIHRIADDLKYEYANSCCASASLSSS